MLEFEKIKLVTVDITQLAVDAIVNAANRTLLGGGGVDGAIHRAAGPDLYRECLMLEGCDTGSAKITNGYRLPAKYVIHAVGPVWRGGNQNEENLLESAYQTCLQLAKQYNCKTVAFPNISTGIYGFPKENAAEIAIRTVQKFLNKNEIPERVYFVCFDQENYNIYQSRLEL
ncbi:MAG: O-acetyl-ADP-ribose deacetylase [Bacteroidales bacterium]|nr:O-acetyl-ADP-ribose deacetylase [Bacteroidales bacterium]